jgi:hypothetical protein
MEQMSMTKSIDIETIVYKMMMLLTTKYSKAERLQSLVLRINKLLHTAMECMYTSCQLIKHGRVNANVAPFLTELFPAHILPP